MRISLLALMLGTGCALSTPTTKSASTATTTTTKSLTQRIMEQTSTQSTGGAGGSASYEAFLAAEENWTRLKQFRGFTFDPKVLNGDGPARFVTDDGATGSAQCWAKLREQQKQQKELDYEVAICGGTLGIFFGTALALKGHKVVVFEAAKLRGREQEWNISLNEMKELLELGVLTQDDIDAVITTEFPACRSGFKNKEVTPLMGGIFENGIGFETTTPNVLNLGVAPSLLLERVKQRFLSLGGTIREETRLHGIIVSESLGAALDLGDEELPVTASLVLDCMGNASPISRQQRYGQKPDGVCAVVGSCASGFDPETNLIGDIIYTNTEIQDKGENGKLQYFWEAFPVNIGRNGKEPGTSSTKTTYMFTYMDAHEKRPSLEMLMEDYWRLLPEYQPSITDPEKDLDIHRVLFAYFPTYRDSPLQPQWSRVLAVGDASGIQSPLSFGGFGALTRHLDRITGAISDALEHSLLSKEDLAEINAYTPNLSAAWMFQKAMSVRMGQSVDPKFINRLLANNFDIMDKMGPRTMMPFLQDVIRVDGLIGSLARSFVSDPTFMPEIVLHVGIPSLVDWLGHVGMMTIYTGLHGCVSPVLRPFVDLLDNPRARFQWRRRMEAWKYGSGGDYILPDED
jgi:2-polyprenyl-6-methoxyphenol hydroxylase-like FAD-dependent oxidoreductase